MLKKFNYTINLNDRISVNRYRPMIFWFTGLSGSGKSTIANGVQMLFFKQNHLQIIVLDGDSVRLGVNSDLKFDYESRLENIRRIAEISRLLLENGLIVIVATISPFKENRNLARNIITDEYFKEVYIRSNLENCKKRDIKGLYKLSENNELFNFTGIDSPYDPPQEPDILIDTSQYNEGDCIRLLYNSISKNVGLT